MRINVYGEKLFVVAIYDRFDSTMEYDVRVAVGQQHLDSIVSEVVSDEYICEVREVDCEVYRLCWYATDEDEWNDFWTTQKSVFETNIENCLLHGIEHEAYIYKKPNRPIFQVKR